MLFTIERLRPLKTKRRNLYFKSARAKVPAAAYSLGVLMGCEVRLLWLDADPGRLQERQRR
jgi:hypothetical protein